MTHFHVPQYYVFHSGFRPSGNPYSRALLVSASSISPAHTAAGHRERGEEVPQPCYHHYILISPPLSLIPLMKSGQAEACSHRQQFQHTICGSHVWPRGETRGQEERSPGRSSETQYQLRGDRKDCKTHEVRIGPRHWCEMGCFHSFSTLVITPDSFARRRPPRYICPSCLPYLCIPNLLPQ